MEPEETVAALKRRDCGNMRREEKGRKHGALVESGGKRRGGDMRREEKGRKHGALVKSGGKRRGGEKAWNLGRSTTGLRWGEAWGGLVGRGARGWGEERGVLRVGRVGRERGGELKRRREGGGEVVRGGRMCRCAEREERVVSGLRCGEANPNQWDGVEPSHWGGPQG